MKIGLIADIHGNYKALTDVFAKIAPFADQIVCLGDIADGGEEDDKCIEFLRDRQVSCIYGGHDWACMKSNRPELKKENMQFLRSLPESLEVEGILMFHDNPLEKARRGAGMWSQGNGIKDLFQAQVVFEECPLFKDKAQIVVVAHTHKPAVFTPKEEIPIIPGETIRLSEAESYLLNPGAVGYSKKTDIANFGMLNTRSLEFTVFEVETDDIFTIFKETQGG